MMEVVAILEGLRALKRACRVEILTDSQLAIEYLGNGRGKTPDLLAIKYRVEVLCHREGHVLTFRKVKAHTGHRLNERAHTLAKAAARSQAEELVACSTLSILKECPSTHFAS